MRTNRDLALLTALPYGLGPRTEAASILGASKTSPVVGSTKCVPLQAGQCID